MSYETLLVHKEGGVTTVTLNRPERLNAFNRQMISELRRLQQEVQEDGETRVLVLTGAGRAFCAGADLRDPGGPGGVGQGQGAEARRQGLRQGAQPLILSFQRLDLPTIAMVNGDAAGGGCDLALACDIRIASEKARFIEAFARIGLFPGTGGCWLLPRAVGLAKAAEMIFTGDPLGAEDAYRLGLVNYLVPHEQLKSKTMEVARRIAEGPPIAIRLAKMVLYRSLETDLETSLELAAAAESITLTSQDHQEGLAAFREKRRPLFRGQ